MSVKESERKRKLHNKVRTGCQTCKIRKKKCDETKPHCLRCTKTGRKCDGYGEVVATGKTANVSRDGKLSAVVPTASETPSETSWSGPVTPATTITEILVGLKSRSPEDSLLHDGAFYDAQDWRCIADLAKESYPPNYNYEKEYAAYALLRPPKRMPDVDMVLDVERHCISYFRSRTIPRLRTYFESSILRSELLPCALTTAHPAIFYATAALGAVHRRYSLGISREAFEYCAHAATLYKKAKQSLASLKKSVSDSSFGLAGTSTIIAAGELLLAIFQGFQTEYATSSAHFSAALRYIFNSPLQIQRSYSAQSFTQIKRRRFSTMLYLLRCQVTQLFGEPMYFSGEEYVFPHTSYSSDQAQPESFRDIKQMRDQLFAACEEIWGTRPRDGMLTTYENVQSYEERLRAWSHASLNLASPDVLRKYCERRAYNLMHVVRSLSYLIVLSGLKGPERHRIRPMPFLPIMQQPEDPDDDSAEVATVMAKIVQPVIGRMYDPDKALTHAVSTIQDVLNKHKIFRHECGNPFESEALSVKNKPVASEDAIEMLGIWSIADKISNVEEDATIEILKHLIPAQVDMKYADIGCILLESRQVGVRYYTAHPSGKGYDWVREWWSF